MKIVVRDRAMQISDIVNKESLALRLLALALMSLALLTSLQPGIIKSRNARFYNALCVLSVFQTNCGLDLLPSHVLFLPS